MFVRGYAVMLYTIFAKNDRKYTFYLQLYAFYLQIVEFGYGVGRSLLFRLYFKARPHILSKKDRVWAVCYTPVPGCSDGTLCKSVTLAH